MQTQTTTPDLEAIKARQQKTWSSGNYARIGNTLVIMGERLCEAVNLNAGQSVLDVATGSGNTALSAARRFANVTGTDYVPSLLEQARARAHAEGLEVRFQQGDAENLMFPDTSFDVVLSTVGVMFAPNQEKTAAELLRVTRPGGKIGLVNWTPEGFIGQLFRATGQHVPPPAGLKSPLLWGTEARLRELFGDQVRSLETTRRHFVFRYPSAQHFVAFFRTFYGPTLKAFEALDATGQEALAATLEALANRLNSTDDGTLAIESEYLEAVAVRR
jgi:SAM-dependent methyltransferase